MEALAPTQLVIAADYGSSGEKGKARTWLKLGLAHEHVGLHEGRIQVRIADLQVSTARVNRQVLTSAGEEVVASTTDVQHHQIATD
jgi:hypothetical protein